MYLSRKFIPPLLTIIALFSISKVYAFKALDSAVAIVEDNVILQSELEQRLNHLKQKQPNVRVNNTIRRQVLDQLITERLQLRVAERIKLPISEGEVDQAINNLKNRLAAESVDFSDYLAQQKLSESQFRKAIKQDITVQKVQEGNINRRIRVTEREIDDFLASKAGQDWLKTRFRLGHILLPIEGSDDTSAAKQAQNLYEELQETPAQFGQIAATHSQGPNANKGGDLGWREKDQLPPLFLEQIASLKPGEITKPFRSNAGIHILRIIQRTGAEPVMVKRFKVRHVLIKTSELFTEKEAKEKINSIHKKLLDGSDFAEIAKEYTEDIGSKADGGSLGWSTPRQFVAEFENTMEATPVGNISEPFRSQFGWHILKVDDSRVEDMFDTVKRNQVVNILRKRRFQDELQLWIQELREDAYIEVMI